MSTKWRLGREIKIQICVDFCLLFPRLTAGGLVTVFDIYAQSLAEYQTAPY